MNPLSSHEEHYFRGLHDIFDSSTKLHKWWIEQKVIFSAIFFISKHCFAILKTLWCFMRKQKWERQFIVNCYSMVEFNPIAKTHYHLNITHLAQHHLQQLWPFQPAFIWFWPSEFTKESTEADTDVIRGWNKVMYLHPPV